jgi:hypothetical protein
LNFRFVTIDWCLTKENFENVVKLRDPLKNILIISAVVSRNITNHGRTGDWTSLKKTVYAYFLICESCAAFNENSVKSTVLHELQKYSADEITIKGDLFALDKIVGLDGVVTKKKFKSQEYCAMQE